MTELIVNGKLMMPSVHNL